MPTWLLIVLLVVLVLVVVLAAGGAIANARRRRSLEGRFRADIQRADRALADAAASDRGWEREGLEAAARRAWERERPDEVAHDFTVVEVVDLPGVDEDRAVFEVRHAGGASRLRLARRDGGWVSEGVEG